MTEEQMEEINEIEEDKTDKELKQVKLEINKAMLDRCKFLKETCIKSLDSYTKWKEKYIEALGDYKRYRDGGILSPDDADVFLKEYNDAVDAIDAIDGKSDSHESDPSITDEKVTELNLMYKQLYDANFLYRRGRCSGLSDHAYDKLEVDYNKKLHELFRYLGLNGVDEFESYIVKLGGN